jgi:tetratricopeptide (TPR) repeat protein
VTPSRPPVTPRPPVTHGTRTLPFDQLAWDDFERLCLALLPQEGFSRSQHYGAGGSEQGRDIVAYRDGDLWYAQCKRVKRCGPKVLLDEIEKIQKLMRDDAALPPSGILFMASSDISATARDRAAKRCRELGLECEVWGRTDLDARVQRHPDIISEFFGFGQRLPRVRAIPPLSPEHFVDRERELTAIKKDLTDAENPQAIVAVYGMGGIGKTALVQKLMEELRSEFPGGVFWADLADSKGNPLSAFIEWGQYCDCDTSRLDKLYNSSGPGACARVMSSILTNQIEDYGRLLIVLDDVRAEWLDRALIIQSARPAGVPLLLTTRDMNLAFRMATRDRSHCLEELPIEEAVALLRELASQVIEQEPEAANRLAEMVGCLPLALELVGKQAERHSQKPTWRLGDLVQQVERGLASEVLQDCPELAVTFALSYDILNDNQKLLFQTLGAFSLASFTAEHVAVLLGWDSKITEARLDELVSLSLVVWRGQEDGQVCYAMHRLLHEFAGQRIPPKKATSFRSELAENAAAFLSSATQYDERTIAITGESLLALGWDKLPKETRIRVLDTLRGLMCDVGTPALARLSAASMLARMDWLAHVDVKNISPQEMIVYLKFLAPFIGLPTEQRILEQVLGDLLAAGSARVADREQAQLLIYRAGMRGQMSEEQGDAQLLNAAARDYRKAKKVLLRLIESEEQPEDYRMCAHIDLGLANVALARSQTVKRRRVPLRKAVELFQAADEVAREHGQDDVLVTIQGQLCYACTLLGYWEKAEQAYGLALEALSGLKEDGKITKPFFKSSQAWVIGTASHMHLMRGQNLRDAKKALVQYKKAYELAEQQIEILEENTADFNEVDLAYAHVTAGDCQQAMANCKPYSDDGNRQTALVHWRTAVNMALRVEYPTEALMDQSLFRNAWPAEWATEQPEKAP